MGPITPERHTQSKTGTPRSPAQKVQAKARPSPECGRQGDASATGVGDAHHAQTQDAPPPAPPLRRAEQTEAPPSAAAMDADAPAPAAAPIEPQPMEEDAAPAPAPAAADADVTAAPLGLTRTMAPPLAAAAARGTRSTPTLSTELQPCASRGAREIRIKTNYCSSVCLPRDGN